MSERIEEIRAEAEKRLKLLLEHNTFEEITVYGSYVRFNMALCPIGNPFDFEPWMNPQEWGPFVTDSEFDSHIYEQAVKPLFLSHT